MFGTITCYFYLTVLNTYETDNTRFLVFQSAPSWTFLLPFHDLKSAFKMMKLVKFGNWIFWGLTCISLGNFILFILRKLKGVVPHKSSKYYCFSLCSIFPKRKKHFWFIKMNCISIKLNHFTTTLYLDSGKAESTQIEDNASWSREERERRTKGHLEVKEKGVETHTINYFWKYCSNVFLNFYIMNVIIDHLDPLKGLLYYFKSKWINTVIKKNGNISFKNLSLYNEKSTELFLEGSNAEFGGAR